MSEFFDALEIRSADERDAAQMAQLRAQVSHAKAATRYFADTLADVDPAALTDRAALAALPLVRKSSILELQAKDPPFGGLCTGEAGGMGRLFVSPGPINDPESRLASEGVDCWRFGRAMFAAGIRAGSVVLNSFSYHLTPGAFMVDSGARACEAAVIPGGTGNTEGQIQAAARFGASSIAATPDFPKLLLEKADELGVDLSIRHLIVSGGPLFPSLRQGYIDAGLTCLQCYGTADLGLVAYESMTMEGMILDEQVLVEIVRPGTGDPVPDGDVGEVVVTSLNNKDYPLIRFATGDLSAVLPGQSACGRTAPRIKGWMGRADQTTKVRGMFVRPEQVADFVSRHAEVEKARFVVGSDAEKRDTLTVLVEVSGDTDPDRLAESVTALCKVRGMIELAEPGHLPNDGKVIDDTRVFD